MPREKEPGKREGHVNNWVPKLSDRSVDEGQVMREVRREDKPNVAFSAIGREAA
jgi:hypothetical protein